MTKTASRALTPEALLHLEGGRVIAFRPLFVPICGGVKPAIFGCQAFYWQRHVGAGHWFYKSIPDWMRELGFTRRDVDKARRALRDRKLLEEQVGKGPQGQPRFIHYRLMLERWAELLNEASITPDGGDVSPYGPGATPDPTLISTASGQLIRTPVVQINHPPVVPIHLHHRTSEKAAADGAAAPLTPDLREDPAEQVDQFELRVRDRQTRLTEKDREWLAELRMSDIRDRGQEIRNPEAYRQSIRSMSDRELAYSLVSAEERIEKRRATEAREAQEQAQASARLRKEAEERARHSEDLAQDDQLLAWFETLDEGRKFRLGLESNLRLPEHEAAALAAKQELLPEGVECPPLREMAREECRRVSLVEVLREQEDAPVREAARV